MLIFQAIVLGVIQGLTEFIPISSSAHLVIVPWLFGWKNPAINGLTFDVALHLGTLIAIIAFFAKDWVRLAAAWFRSIAQRKIGADPDRRMAWYLLLACIPGGLAGLLFEDKVQAAFHVTPLPQASMLLMAAALALMGGLLWLVDALSKRARSLGSMGAKDAAAIGLAQALAILPGVSRSGSTITAGLALGFERDAAAKFSFLLSAPIIAGAGLKSLVDLAQELKAGAIMPDEKIIFPIGFVAALAAGLLCIKFLMSFLKRYSTRSFTWYRWALAILVAVVAIVRG